MSREEVEKYAQDRLGNVRRDIDELRAAEGQAGLDTGDGIVEVTSGETGTPVLAYSAPTHASQVILTGLDAFNSVGSGYNTVKVLEAELDSNGSITSTTQRSVPIQVGSGSTRTEDYEGLPFENHIAVESEFEGQIGVSVISDHHEEDEPAYTTQESPPQ